VIHTPAIEWLALLPDVILLCGGGLLLVVAVTLRGRRARDAAFLVGAGCLVASAVSAIAIWSDHGGSWPVLADQFIVDRFTNMIRVIVAASGLLTLFASYGWPRMRERGPEFVTFLLVAAAGMDLLAGSASFVSLFVSLELFSVALYALCAIDVRSSASLESGLKYLVLGSVGSAVLVYGSAFLYGATGSLTFAGIGLSLAHGHATDLLALAGTALVLAGLAFKIAVVPFHMWTPDVYEGAPTPVTAFMSAATKAAAFAILFRVTTVAFAAQANQWRPAIVALSIATMLFANVAALRQQNVKRILAYSSIGHAGYLLMAIVAFHTSLAGKALVFYLAVYAVTSVGAFLVVTVRERETGEPVTLTSLRGWGFSRPVVGAAMAVFLLSLAGFPPTAGFLAKVYLFAAAIRSGYTYLAVIGAAGTVISLGYYLRIGLAMFDLRERRDAAIATGAGAVLAGLGAAAAAAVVIWLGVYPPDMLRWAGDAAQSLALGR
jgi:NADH-quinone oxidoreductase subunit N